jgi:hypothetical protein
LTFGTDADGLLGKGSFGNVYRGSVTGVSELVDPKSRHDEQYC